MYIVVLMYLIIHSCVAMCVSTTVNGGRFAGLNFCVFHGFQEYRESFSVNVSTSL